MLKKYIESFARYGGLAAVCFEWLSVLIFYVREPADFGGQHPISYFATLPQTRLVFSVCYTLAALSFWVFVKWHLSKHYLTSTTLFAWSMLVFAAVAIVPFHPDNPASSAIHSLLALA